MAYLGMASKKPQEKDILSEGSRVLQNSSIDDAKMLAATALSAVRDATATISGRGKVEVSLLSSLLFICFCTLLGLNCYYLGIWFFYCYDHIELKIVSPVRLDSCLENSSVVGMEGEHPSVMMVGRFVTLFFFSVCLSLSLSFFW